MFFQIRLESWKYLYPVNIPPFSVPSFRDVLTDRLINTDTFIFIYKTHHLVARQQTKYIEMGTRGLGFSWSHPLILKVFEGF